MARLTSPENGARKETLIEFGSCCRQSLGVPAPQAPETLDLRGAGCLPGSGLGFHQPVEAVEVVVGGRAVPG